MAAPGSHRRRGDVSVFAAAPDSGRGFTLVELVITVAIIAILASLAMPLAEVTVQRSREQDLRRSLREIREAIDAYKLAWDEGRVEKSVGETGYPRNLELLVEGVTDLKNPKPTKIYFLRRIPRDPFSTDPSVTAAATWSKRSYQSGPENPQEGDNVYDVTSRSPGIGLNGVRHREW